MSFAILFLKSGLKVNICNTVFCKNFSKIIHLRIIHQCIILYFIDNE